MPHILNTKQQKQQESENVPWSVCLSVLENLMTRSDCLGDGCQRMSPHLDSSLGGLVEYLSHVAVSMDSLGN